MNFIIRLISGVSAFLILFGSVAIFGAKALFFWIPLLGALTIKELLTLAKASSKKRFFYTLLFLINSGIVYFKVSLVYSLVLIFFFLMCELWSSRLESDLKKVYSKFILSTYIINFIQVPCIALMLALHNVKNGLFYVLLMSAVFAFDSFAYVSGKQFGGRVFKADFFPFISGKKTWEGILGGALGCFFATMAIYLLFFDQSYMSFKGMFFYSLLVPVFASFGDLLGSLFKRTLKAKDSGNFLPGHGGLYDRFDALVCVAPLIYIFLSR